MSQHDSELVKNRSCQIDDNFGSGMMPRPPGLNPINKNLSSQKFSDQNLKILNPPIFSESLRNFQTKYFGAAGRTDF